MIQFARTFEIEERRQLTHLVGPFSDDQTLCGMDLAGDETIYRKQPEFLNPREKHRLTCKQCCATIDLVKEFLETTP